MYTRTITKQAKYKKTQNTKEHINNQQTEDKTKDPETKQLYVNNQ